MSDLTIRIEELLERGHEAFEKYIQRLYLGQPKPIGIDGVSVVLWRDFIAHSDICFAFVMKARTIMLLDDGGAPIALLCRHTLPLPREG